MGGVIHRKQNQNEIFKMIGAIDRKQTQYEFLNVLEDLLYDLKWLAFQG